MPQSAKPLTTFLMALAHSPALVQEFTENPDEVLAQWELQQYASLLAPPVNLTEVEQAVANEFAGEEGVEPKAFPWILIWGSPSQDNWILSPSDEDEHGHAH